MSDAAKMSPQVWDAATGVSKLEQCASFEGPMVVRMPDDLSGLERFTSLRTLEIVGGDVADLAPLASLGALRKLKIVCAKVSDLSPLATLTELEDLEINFTFVEDLSVLDGLHELGWLKLFGNPLESKSFHEVLERKRTTDVARWGRPCIVEASGEDEWAACRKLFETGAKACWGQIPRSLDTLVRPGRAPTGMIEFLELEPVDIENILAKPDPAKAPLVAEMWVQEDVDHDPQRFGVRWLAGAEVDASKWLQASSLSDDEQQACLRFVRRFASETFYREHDSLLKLQMVRKDVRLPDWFQAQRRDTLAGVRPHWSVIGVQIGAFAQRTPTRSGGWYDFGWIGYGNPDLRALLHDRLHLFPIAEIAEARDAGHSVLAIKLGGDDRAIYEVDPMYAAATEPVVTQVFGSYGALLDRITALRTNDVVTEAKG